MAKQELVVPEKGGALVGEEFFRKGDVRGTEDITNDDIQMPRLALAQDMSPQRKETESNYIEGLKVGDLFNSLTSDNYGPGPLFFYILRRDQPRFMELIPRKEGGGIRDPKVAPDDPRTEFGPNGEKPIATKFYDYIIVLEPINQEDLMSSMIALSLKDTSIKKAKALNGFIKLRNKPIFAGRYEVRSVDESNKLGKYKNYQFRNAGSAQSVELVALLEAGYESLKNRPDIKVDRDVGGADEEGDASFNTTEM